MDIITKTMICISYSTILLLCWVLYAEIKRLLSALNFIGERQWDPVQVKQYEIYNVDSLGEEFEIWNRHTGKVEGYFSTFLEAIEYVKGRV